MNRCMAHRGWSGRAPENTMAAIRLALQEPRVKALEIDVQLTKDRVPVIIHDFSLDRTTNGTGFVASHTYEELSRLDAGRWFGAEFSGETIPTLDKVLLEVGGRCLLNLELKTAGDRYPGIEKIVVDYIHRYKMEKDVYITSFDHEVIQKVRRLGSLVRTGLIISGKPTLLEQQLRETGASVVSMDYVFLTKDFVQEMMGKGIDMVAWTVNDPLAIQQLMEMHPQLQICTNYPDRMFPYMK